MPADPPDWTVAEHKLAGYERSRRGHYAVCTCGYRGKKYGSQETAFRWFLKHVVRAARMKARISAET